MTELFFSGYCRKLDASRMVALVIEDGKIDEVDCDFIHCPYAPNCQIGRKIEEALE